MRKFGCGVLMTALLVLIGGSCAWSGVSVSWTDSEGSKNADLLLVPANTGDPYYMGMEAVWFGELNIVMDTLGPIAFTASGNYDGVFPGGYYGNWYQVVLEQNILNSTGVAWTEFHLGIDGAHFGWVHKTNNWAVDQQDLTVDFTSNGSGGPPVADGGMFYDGVSIFDVDDLPSTVADFTLTKWATPIPEASGLAVLLGGIGSFITIVRRRRA